MSRDEVRKTIADDSLHCSQCKDWSWKRCHCCKQKMRSTHSGVQCVRCSKQFHLDCAKIPRALRRNLQWTCNNCDEPEEQREEEAEKPRTTCCECRSIIRSGASRRQCSTCERAAHLKCSRDNPWNCTSCSTENGATVATRRDEAPKGSSHCKCCQGKINRGATRATCKICTKEFHLKCVADTRKRQEQIRCREWKCDSCKAASAEQSRKMDNNPLKPSKEKCEQEVVTILQWNADGIHGKIDELEDFLRTNEIDVACIQESKETPTTRRSRLKDSPPGRSVDYRKAWPEEEESSPSSGRT